MNELKEMRKRHHINLTDKHFEPQQYRDWLNKRGEYLEMIEDINTTYQNLKKQAETFKDDLGYARRVCDDFFEENKKYIIDT